VRTFYTYILASKSRVLYIGVTNDLIRRMYEHRASGGTYTRKYRVTKLVYYEVISGALTAIAREKQLKAWSRKKKVELIEVTNPAWLDLSFDWFD
jgi:putative endonuclease